MEEAANSLDGDYSRDDEQRDTVDRRGEHLEAPQAECPYAAGRSLREPRGGDGHEQREDIGQHVPGISEQCKRRRGNSHADLGRHEQQEQARRREEQPDVAVRIALVRVRAHGYSVRMRSAHTYFAGTRAGSWRVLH